jgi:hypothetical protein
MYVRNAADFGSHTHEATFDGTSVIAPEVRALWYESCGVLPTAVIL